MRRPWDAKLDVFKVLLEGLWGSFWSPNSPETQKNHDLKTHVLEDVFSETFFNDFERFSDILGPSEPLKSSKSHGRYCIFAKIAFFTPRGVPRAIVDDFPKFHDIFAPF